ncbi:MAG: hypothetical protein HPY70_06195 [Firmicutes bacterium]|nr:hypothetical protein [Bacillota bacterium]
MSYLAMIFILAASVYSFSFARYCWKKQNRIAAVGALLLTLVSIILPAVMLFFPKWSFL